MFVLIWGSRDYGKGLILNNEPIDMTRRPSGFIECKYSLRTELQHKKLGNHVLCLFWCEPQESLSLGN